MTLRRIRCEGRPVSLIVLAGGRGLRMSGARGPKATLRIGGVRLIDRVLGQVRGRFDEILVSVSRGVRWPAIPEPKVKDECDGAGPMAGLLSGLRAARNDVCAVLACDIPDVDLAVLRRIVREAAGVDIAVPVTPEGRFEPLYAAYRKSVIPAIESLLAGGTRGLTPLFDRCRTRFVPLADAAWLRNLNTRTDVREYMRSRRGS